MKKILVFSGSTRKESLNRKLVAEVLSIKLENARLEEIDLKDYPMPLYDGDLESEQGPPTNALKLKKVFAEADGIIISSPEYNSSVSAVLKNTLDWMSRPGGEHKPYAGKFALILAASPSASGGIRVLYHLESILQNFGVFVLPDKFPLREADRAFDSSGRLKDQKLKKQLYRLVEKLEDMIIKQNR